MPQRPSTSSTGGTSVPSLVNTDASSQNEAYDSITSSVKEHVYEGGMRYHAYKSETNYAFPNDENFQNCEDMKHEMALTLCSGRFHYAPIEYMMVPGAHVLDLGTGTGIWAIEFGDRYPDAEVVGYDFSPIQPSSVPQNVRFIVDDFEDEWVDPENKFDFVFIRFTIRFVKNRKALLDRIYRHLKPGGYVEIHDMNPPAMADDDSISPEKPYAVRTWLDLVGQGCDALGGCVNAMRYIPDELAKAGFKDTQIVSHKCPLGGWPQDPRLRRVGTFLAEIFMEGMKGLSYRPFTTGLGWSPDQLEVYLATVRPDLSNPNFHTYYPYNIVYARKPTRL
ncbi:S-adenosyl-L-methionine-dependent methyltransferase [Pseudomassariella vexata]|uniref:S-adenosyl-L-methionine-dependent methyltransferase n=1 Tax=Pseudomassariella vexata TaxID=1141098 RepID=A0A1Y2DGM7_9PEZI|nr:S-adenosyl-L-methionine-dependent methyltransferase [Pseudomassariella vexata]ORY58399.1 S-adenosyl-L-methionine-dependent methyltransferase [Pseudomassariella vexata]